MERTISTSAARTHNLIHAELVPPHPELPWPPLQANLHRGRHEARHVVDGGHGHDDWPAVRRGVDDLGDGDLDIQQIVPGVAEVHTAADVQSAQPAREEALVEHAAGEDGVAHGMVAGGQVVADGAGVLVEEGGDRGPVRHGPFEFGRHECADACMAGGVD